MNNHSKTFHLTFTAAFAAVIFLLGMTPLGLIPLGFINVTILCVPVVAGTLLLGLKSGLILGACFGIASTLSAFGLSMTAPSALALALAQRNPALAVAMCVVPRLAVPVVAHLVYRLGAKGRECSTRALPFAAAAGSLTNTVLYLGLMLLFYIAAGIDAQPVLGLIAGVAATAGISEAAVAALLVTPIVGALRKAGKKQE
ncbi:ECF transporter S component [Bacillota bacterium Meth-B3]|nr:ECF transporter S component [Christensenellaceae bacterium]MEA5066169.1 ECF transporter S component [Eubacteriales bacterium]MEA5070276.1 ECF transporter S component [Christensenellaceae bacterium]